MTYQQPDFFGESQPDLFDGDTTPAFEAKPDPDRIRARLLRIIAEAQAADAMPWTKSKEKLYRAMVPQLALGLPEEESSQLKFEFEIEMQRLALAA
jgi:hypothetical protein